MSKLIAALKQERTRAYIYRVLTGVGVVAFSYGLVSAEEIAVWSGLVATVFVLPAANTSIAKPFHEGN